MSHFSKDWRDFNPALRGATQAAAKKARIRSEPTEIDGVRFASKREASRYADLKLQQAAGLISHLELQPQFPLTVTNPQGVAVTIGRYIADFRYRRDGQTIVEDAKGFRTEIYRLKSKWVEALYGIEVVEV
jgi:hypothetical protein